MNHKHILVAAVVLLATACAQGPQAPAAAPSAAGGNCNAAGAQFAIGRIASGSLVEQARVLSGALMARVLRPGQVVTLEFNAQRLNLDLDSANVVTRARCG
jgi:hypothetical protein